MNMIARELVKTNQRLNEIKEIPIGHFEKELTKRVKRQRKPNYSLSIDFQSLARKKNRDNDK